MAATVTSPNRIRRSGSQQTNLWTLPTRGSRQKQTHCSQLSDPIRNRRRIARQSRRPMPIAWRRCVCGGTKSPIATPLFAHQGKPNQPREIHARYPGDISMLKKLIASVAVVGLFGAGAVLLQAAVTQPEPEAATAAVCDCCDVCNCDDCVCDALSCACDDGGDCFCTDDCSATCCDH